MYLNRCGKYTGKKINPNPTPRDGVIRGSCHRAVFSHRVAYAETNHAVVAFAVMFFAELVGDYFEDRKSVV